MNNAILRPDVRYRYMGYKGREKIEYLSIPKDIDISDLSAAIKGGASQFKEIKSLVENDKPMSNYIVITADKRENAFMAVMYHAACMNQISGDFSWEEEDDRDADRDTSPEDNTDDWLDEDHFVDPEEAWIRSLTNDYKGDPDEDYVAWEDDLYSIPLIPMTDFNFKASRKDENPYFFNQFSMMGQNETINPRPYWELMEKTAVCIYDNTPDDENGFFVGDFGLSDEAIESLSIFSNNRFVYIIYIKQRGEDNDHNIRPFDELAETQFITEAERSRNRMVLAHVAEEISVVNSNKDKYIRYLLNQNVQKMGYSLIKGFAYGNMIKRIKQMERSQYAVVVERLVQYCLRRRKDKDKTLKTEDFDFLERFVRSFKSKESYTRGARKRLETNLIGMAKIKEQVIDVVNVMKFNMLRREHNILGGAYHNVHMMLGAPGTAKTTVAKLMGEIMCEEHLLPGVRFTCVNGAELKGMYVGHSAPKTHAIFENNDIIVIDEAYSLVDDRGDNDSFSKEAIAQMIIEIEEHSMDKLVIFAGYGGKGVTEENDKMKAFIDANPGIKSRITSTFVFESYSADEMTEIFFKQAQLQKYRVTGGRDIILEFFRDRVTDPNFGNGREARSLLETATLFTARRVLAKKTTKYSSSDLKTICEDDIKNAIEKVKGEQFGVKHTTNVIGF